MSMSSEQSQRGEKNRRLKDQFLEVLENLGQELLPEDTAVVEAFLHAPHHVDEQDILARIEMAGIDLSHVKRTMRMLCDLGIAQRVRLGDKTVYEHLHLESHHDHLVCVRCGRIVEFVDDEIENRQRAIAARHGFTPLMHKMELRGLCHDCGEATPATRALASCLPGEWVVVAEVLGGCTLRRRLLDLGLPPGTRVRIISSEGPVAIEVRGSRLALGRNEAAKIIVRKPE